LVHKDVSFGVGDRVKVYQRLEEKGKTRLQVFEGIVIRIKGEQKNKTFTVRKIGEAKIGIEKIFPIHSPTIEKVELVKSGVKGVRRAKLYFIRGKTRKEMEKIYLRASRRK